MPNKTKGPGKTLKAAFPSSSCFLPLSLCTAQPHLVFIAAEEESYMYSTGSGYAKTANHILAHMHWIHTLDAQHSTILQYLMNTTYKFFVY